MAECQGTDKLFFRILVFHGVHYHWVRGADTLVSRPAIAHHRYHGPTHSGVAGQCCLGDDVRVDAVTKYPSAQWAVHCLAQAVSVVALQRLLGSIHVILFGFQHKPDFVDGGGGGEVVDHPERKLYAVLLRFILLPQAFVK